MQIKRFADAKRRRLTRNAQTRRKRAKPSLDQTSDTAFAGLAGALHWGILHGNNNI